MRLAFLYEDDLEDNLALETIFSFWLKGLSDSGFEIMVITTAVAAERLSDTASPRIAWRTPNAGLGWLSWPSIIRNLMTFQPQLLHLVLGRKPRWPNHWMAAAGLTPLGIDVVVSPGDQVQWQDSQQWPHAILKPGAQWAPSLEDMVLSPTEALVDVFVPGPLKRHSDWRRTLFDLFHWSEQNPERALTLGFSWDEIPLPERLEWRERWLAKGEQSRIHSKGTLPINQQRQLSKVAKLSRLDLLPTDTWHYALLKASQNSAVNDQVINLLMRFYHQPQLR